MDLTVMERRGSYTPGASAAHIDDAKRPNASLTSREGLGHLVRFLAVGTLNTAFGYAIYAIGIFAGISPPFALGIAVCCGVVFNFFTTGRLVFREKAMALFPRFALGYALVYVFNLGLLQLATGAGVGPLLAQALALPPTVVVTFLLMKFVVFRR